MKEKITMRNLINILDEKGIYRIPALKEEIAEIRELSFNKKLPLEYEIFLEDMGKGTPVDFLVGESCFINEIPNLKKWALELLIEDNSTLELSPEDFVFWMHQGYQFAFFKIIDEIETLDIYFYLERENQKEFIKVADGLAGFLYKLM